MTACGGGALPNDGSVAPDTQNDRCADNPLADGCQASAGFLSVNLDEDIGNQEAESSVAPVVNTPPAQKLQETPVVKKTEPVLKELAKKQTPPTPAPITSVDSYDFVPKTAYSTQSAPAEQRSGSAVSGDSGASGQQSASVTAAAAFAGLDETRVLPTSQHGLVTNLAALSNKFLKAGWTHTQVASDVILFDQRNSKGVVQVYAGTPIPLANRPTYEPIVRKNLNRAGLVLGDSLYMNLYNARYDGVAIGGDAEDGIDFYTVSTLSRTGTIKHLGQGNGIENTLIRTVSRFHYAGILAGTDLGAPVSTTDPTAIWNGSFRTDDARYPVDFQLTVTFGTTNDTRTISAFVKDTATRAGVNDYYLLAGNYDENGLITGTVNYGEFTGGERNTPTGDRTPGTIQGLIGVEGAVGVFMSDVAESTATVDLTGAITFTNGYVGGFVAAPSDIATGNTHVTFSDWTRDTARSATLNTGTRANEFLAGGAFGLRTTGAINLPTQENALRGIISRADCAAINARFAGKTIITTTAGTYTVMNNHPLDDTSVVKTMETTTTSPTFSTRDCDLTDMGSLNLATATLGADSYDDEDNKIDNRISKIARGGVAFFKDGDQSYAGLLSGTDLGAPLTATDTVGRWHGQFKSIGAYYFGGDSSTGTRVDTALDLEFTLTVNFGMIGSIPGSIGSLSAFVPIDEAGRHFYLTGTYDANGVIKGYVRGANFNFNGTLIRPTDRLTNNNNSNGVLTGLIGAHGAVGAFVSNADNYNYAGGFVAAPPPILDDATFATWEASFGVGELNAGQTLLAEDGVAGIKADATIEVAETVGTNSSHFIRGTETGIAGIYTPFDPDRVVGFHLDDGTKNDDGTTKGDTDNGVAFGFINTDSTDINDRPSGTGLYFAGLLSGADVGAPLNSQPAPIDATKSTAAFWTGKIAGFYAGHSLGDNLTGVTLNLRVAFTGDGGTVANWNADADDGRTVAGISVGRRSTFRYLRLAGSFTAGGLLTGTVNIGTNTIVTEGIQSGTFNGIIGKKGAVAAFKSDDTNDVHFAGGFVAVPTEADAPIEFTRAVTDPGNGGGGGGGGTTMQVTGEVAYQAWADSFTGGVNAALTLQDSGYTAPAGASADFIRLDGSDNIVVKGIDFSDSNNDTVTGLLRLNLAATSTDAGYNSGVAYAHAFVGSDSQLYAGLLPGTSVTDLGGPITNVDKNGTWSGTLAGFDIFGDPISDTTFNLTVTFGAGDQAGTITSKSTGFFDVFIANDFGIYFDGNFDTNGVMSGTTTGSLGYTANGTFNGLIGVDGAVGAFKGINATGDEGYIGGFQVKPPTE